MRRLSVALSVVGVSLALAACVGDRDTTSPSSLSPRGSASFVTSATCDYNSTMKGYARDYFTSGTTRNDVMTLIGQMASATTSANRQAVAFSIMKKVASGRLTSETTNSTAGALFVEYVLGCGDIEYADLATHAALVLNSGIFEVRGGTSDDDYQALAFVKTSAGARALATPRWGVQPSDEDKTWAATAGSFLVIGYPKYETPEAGVGTPALINTNDASLPTGGYNAFELGTVPNNKEAGGDLLVGLCVSPFITGSEETNIFFHEDTIQVNQSPSFCTTSDIPNYASVSGKSWFANVADRLTSVIAPEKLQAEEGDSKLGGLPSGWSPFHSGKLKGSGTTLAFTAGHAPTDGYVNVVQGDVIVEVKVPSTDPAAAPGTMVHAPPGVLITLSIAGNNGSPAFFTANGTKAKAITVATDANGIATFADFSVSKAGGYLATIVGSIAGLTATQSLTTGMFWIKNKTL